MEDFTVVKVHKSSYVEPGIYCENVSLEANVDESPITGTKTTYLTIGGHRFVFPPIGGRIEIEAV